MDAGSGQLGDTGTLAQSFEHRKIHNACVGKVWIVLHSTSEQLARCKCVLSLLDGPSVDAAIRTMGFITERHFRDEIAQLSDCRCCGISNLEELSWVMSFKLK